MLKITEYTGKWCGVCKSIKPVVTTIISGYKNEIEFEELDAEENIEKAKAHEVSHLPTFIFEKDGQVVAKKSGFINPTEFKKLIEDNK